MTNILQKAKPVRLWFGLLLAFMGSYVATANGKLAVPAVPTLAQCHQLARINNSPEGNYPSRQVFLACLVAGTPETLFKEADNLAKQAQQILDKLQPNGTAQALLATLRAAHAHTNLSLLTTQQGSRLNYRSSENFTRRLNRVKYSVLLQTNLAIEKQILAHYERLDAQNPGFKQQRLDGQKITRNFCRGKLDAYKEGRLREPERNFLFVESYQSSVLPCAEMFVNFYPLLASRYEEKK